MSSENVSSVFGNLLSSPSEMAGWMAVTVLLGFLVCSRGLQAGVEKISKVMMLILFGLILVLAIHSCMLPERRRAQLLPDSQPG